MEKNVCNRIAAMVDGGVAVTGSGSLVLWLGKCHSLLMRNMNFQVNCLIVSAKQRDRHKLRPRVEPKEAKSKCFWKRFDK